MSLYTINVECVNPRYRKSDVSPVAAALPDSPGGPEASVRPRAPWGHQDHPLNKHCRDQHHHQ